MTWEPGPKLLLVLLHQVNLRIQIFTRVQTWLSATSEMDNQQLQNNHCDSTSSETFWQVQQQARSPECRINQSRNQQIVHRLHNTKCNRSTTTLQCMWGCPSRISPSRPENWSDTTSGDICYTLDRLIVTSTLAFLLSAVMPYYWMFVLMVFDGPSKICKCICHFWSVRWEWIQRLSVLFFCNKQPRPTGCYISRRYDKGRYITVLSGSPKQHGQMGPGLPSLDWLSQPLVISSRMVSFACDASRIGNLNRMLGYIARPDGVASRLPPQACSKSHSIAIHVIFPIGKLRVPPKAPRTEKSHQTISPEAPNQHAKPSRNDLTKHYFLGPDQTLFLKKNVWWPNFRKWKMFGHLFVLSRKGMGDQTLFKKECLVTMLFQNNFWPSRSAAVHK